MFPQLSTLLGLENQQSIPPPGSCIAICDLERQPVSRPQGSFIQLHLMSLYLRQKHPCVFFSLTDTYSHLKVISAKCGFGVQSYVDSGLLKYVSALTMCHDAMQATASDTGSESTVPSLEAVSTCLKNVVNDLKNKFVDKTPFVVLEDLSVFLDLGVDVHDLFVFIRFVRSLVSEGALIVYATSAEDGENEEILCNFLFHYADWCLETSGLRTGLSSTIDGQLDIRIRNVSRPGCVQKTSHYKVQDRRIQFFAPGTSAGIL